MEAGEQGAPAHVVIDEVQDLVDVRREMVEELLDRFADTCGFTVVGDAAQSVYGFQVADPEQRAQEVNHFFDWVRASYGEDLVELHLGDNFRARTEDARIALPFGRRIQHFPDDSAEAARRAERLHADLRAALARVPHFGELSDPFVRDSLREFPGVAAILCRDNGQVLRISELLDECDVPHRIQRPTRDQSAPVWLDGLMTGAVGNGVTYDRFHELLTEQAPPPGADPESLWRSLRKVARGARGRLDLSALHRAVADGRLPDELTAPAPASLVVSTVHRAKGLEFDRVLLPEPAVLRPPKVVAKKKYDYDATAEVRLLYVAMTRPRDDLYRIDAPVTWQLRKNARLGRWYVGGRESWARNGVEILGTDVDHRQPPGAEDRNAPAVRLYLHDCVRPGDPVRLHLAHRLVAADDESPPYWIVHAGRPVGEVSVGFRRDLHSLLMRSAGTEIRRWPSVVTGLRIDTVETVAGSSAASERSGIGPQGSWLAPRLSGLGRFDWTQPEDSFDLTQPEGPQA